jgi:hypothetical protein
MAHVVLTLFRRRRSFHGEGWIDRRALLLSILVTALYLSLVQASLGQDETPTPTATPEATVSPTPSPATEDAQKLTNEILLILVGLSFVSIFVRHVKP